MKKGSTSVTTPTNGTNPIIVAGTGMNKSKKFHGIRKPISKKIVMKVTLRSVERSQTLTKQIMKNVSIISNFRRRHIKLLIDK